MESTDAFLSTILSIVQSGVHSVANNCTETFGQDIANILKLSKVIILNDIHTESFLEYFFKQNFNYMNYESKILSQKLVRKKKSNKSMIMEKKYL